jgi:lysophospholipase L1-like esterase
VEYRSNLITIIAKLRTFNPDISILLVTPPPVDHDTINPLWDRRLAVKAYAEVVIDLSASERTFLVNLWHGPNALLFSDLHDGLHPNASGNNKIMKAIQHTINTELPHLRPSNLVQYPNWFELMSCDPDKVKDLVLNSRH